MAPVPTDMLVIFTQQCFHSKSRSISLRLFWEFEPICKRLFFAQFKGLAKLGG